MNILFIDSIEKNIYGGMEEWIRLVANGLTRMGHSVTICTRKDSEFIKRLEDKLTKVNLLPLEISGDFNPSTIKQIRNYILKKEIDIVVANFNKDLRLGGLAAKLGTRAKVIWSLGINLTSERLIHKLLTPSLFDGIIVPSLSLKNQIVASGYIKAEMVEIIPIGISETENRPGKKIAREQLQEKYKLSEDSLIAVVSGRFVEQKGQKYLVEAASEIVKEFPLLKILLLGDGPLRQELEAQINELNLNDSFIFCGMLKDLSLELEGADLMIHPSVEEPFGIAILEGMRAGLPVVASSVGGIPEVVKENETALLFEPENVTNMIEEISKMLSSESLRLQFGEAGYKRWQENFKYSQMIDAVDSYFLSTLNREKVNG